MMFTPDYMKPFVPVWRERGLFAFLSQPNVASCLLDESSPGDVLRLVATIHNIKYGVLSDMAVYVLLPPLALIFGRDTPKA